MAECYAAMDNDDAHKLLDYIKYCTNTFATAGEENMKKLSKLGLSEEDVVEIAKNTKIDKIIIKTQKHNMTDVLLKKSSVIPVLTETVLQTIKEKSIKKELIRENVKIQQRVKDLEEFYSLVNRKFEKLQKEKQSVEIELQQNHELNYLIEKHGKEMEQLKKNSQIQEDNNLTGILDKIQKLYASITDTSINSQKIMETLKQYSDLPPDILMAKCALSEAEQKYNELQSKINLVLSQVK